MSNILTLNQFQHASMRTMQTGATEKESLCNYAMGLTGEAGEVVDILKKHLFHGHELDKSKIEEELGDTLFYINAIAVTLGLSLEAIAEGNIEKLKRRYKNGFSHEASINRIE